MLRGLPAKWALQRSIPPLLRFTAPPARALHAGRYAVDNTGAVRQLTRSGEWFPSTSQPEPAPSGVGGLPGRLLRHVLPRGFPHTVAPWYAEFAAWHALSATASAAGGVLAMQSLLYAVGLGAGAVPVAGAVNWVLKDGVGQLGGMLFASATATRFDSDPKRWRVLAGVALDAACLLEIATAAAPAAFLPIAAVANVGKNISWISASATRAAVHQAASKTGALADVTAKSGSQSMAASTLGTGLGVALSPLVGSDPGVIAPVFVGLSAVHLLCLVKSMSAVHLSSFNVRRLAAAVSPAFRDPLWWQAPPVPGKLGLAVSTPEEVSEALGLDLLPSPCPLSSSLSVGGSLEDMPAGVAQALRCAVSSPGASQLHDSGVFTHCHSGGMYTLAVAAEGSGRQRAHLLLSEAAGDGDVVCGALHALALSQLPQAQHAPASAALDSGGAAAHLLGALQAAGWSAAHHKLEG